MLLPWLFAAAPQAAPTDSIALTPSMVIDRSVRITNQTYSFVNGDNEGKTAAIVIRGSNLTVDFGGATLLGSDWETEPDQRKGTAVLVEGSNITIRNLRAHGYKIGLIARNSPNLRILDSDFSYNWKQRLKSTAEKEDLADWMSFHRNEDDQWLRFGAGVYLRNCDDVEVKGVRIVSGQCGLMMTDCDRGRVWNNSFSFLSAVGLGMYRTSDVRVMHNNIDWCVRGYSHGRWNRGQDSTGILIYEQSHRNVFAYNSVTHGGDGFFLWAGQTTMDTGQGGCNDNLLYGNDFSHAPTNGIEATFSRNKFINNLILECWHGIWGGYSYDSMVLGNVFGHNAEAIAWEHGQNNTVDNNLFYRDTAGLVIWQNDSQDPNWGYPKNRDTRSRDWRITFNEFNNMPGDVMRVRETLNFAVLRNAFSSVQNVIKTTGKTDGHRFERNRFWVNDAKLVPKGLENAVQVRPTHKPDPATMQPSGNVILGLDSATEAYLERFNLLWAPYPTDPKPNRNQSPDPFMDRYLKETRKFAPTPMTGGRRPFIKPGQLRGRRYILVDEWGPYDFKSPKLWPRGEVNGKLRLEVLGPNGSWKVVNQRGIMSLSKSEGETPDFIEVVRQPTQANDWRLELEFTGEAIVTPFGKRIASRTPYRFSYSEFFVPINWNVSIYSWDPAKVADPKSAMPKLADLALGEPVATAQVDRLDYSSASAFLPGAPSNHFATIAEATFQGTPGTYTFEVTTDDGVRLFVDGKLVLESWKYQGPTAYSADVTLNPNSRVRIEHYEIDGFSALQVKLNPKR